MRKLRFAKSLGLLSAALTLFLVIAVRLRLLNSAYRDLKFINYMGIRFGPSMIGSFFDPNRFGPVPKEALLFDVFLVLTSAVQWFIVGLLIDLAMRRRAT